MALTIDTQPQIAPSAEAPAVSAGTQIARPPNVAVAASEPQAEAAAPRKHSQWARDAGEWAHKHRGFFASLAGDTLVRNMGKILLNLIPTAFVFAGTRHAFKAFNDRPVTSYFSKALQSLTSNKLIEQMAFILGGFTVFRTSNKIFQRNYDRIFADSADASKAIDAIENLPGNALKDLKEVLLPEIAGTAVATLPLAAVKMGLHNPKGGFVNDWLSSAAAYLPFFQLNDRLYNDITKGKDSQAYYDALRHPQEKVKEAERVLNEPAEKKEGFLTKDGPARLVFQSAASLLVGVAPYVALQRATQRAIGSAMPENGNSCLINALKTYALFAGFSMFTVGSELYSKAYDALAKKLEAHHTNDNTVSR